MTDTQQQQQLASSIINYMRIKKYNVSEVPGTYNIVYIEGADKDGNPNADEIDKWNDRRIVITFTAENGWTIIHNEDATTEPGREYTIKPINGRAAARIAFGQYTAWAVGKHQQQQTALVQVRAIPVHRDINRNGKRDKTDPIQRGVYGLNQHSTRRFFEGGLVGRFSAGCLVGRDYEAHLEFMRIVQSDIRFVQDRNNFLFTTTLIDGDDFAKFKNLI